MLLIRQAAVYAPEYLGVRDVLVCGGVIEAVEEQIEGELPFCKVIDGRGKKLTPGFIDPHVHITGGGGEGSFHTQVPPVKLSELLQVGYIQRSRGYSLRPSLSPQEIGQIAAIVHRCSDAVVMVDNCYGEFVCEEEPTQCGADLIAGSLIKNPGGGIAPTGGYIAGRHDLIELCAQRMTTPGLGKEVGATLNLNRSLFMGLFHAPHVTGEALKAAVFTAALFERFGYGVTPCYQDERYDIIQSVLLENPESLIAFCQGMQKGAPVDSFVSPEPWDMPGYDSQVIMSAGAFTLGASIELSADAPLREPYAAWMQGGLNFHSAKVGVMLAAQEMENRGLLK